MTALRHLSDTNDSVNVSIDRLSTGLKINSAADDPAGLIISEGMQSQIKGTQQAIQNSQNAVNMSKTADGAMSEVQNLLQNIRTVAVAAANSAVVDSAQLQADQQQIQSTIQSINRIASSTAWGQKKLLDGTAGVQANVTDSTNVAGIYMGSSFGGSAIGTGPVTVQVTTQAKQTTLSNNKTFANASALVGAGSFVINGQTFTTDGVTSTLQNVITQINSQSGTTGVSASAVPSGANVVLQLQSLNYGSQFPIHYFDAGALFNTAANPAPTVAGTDAVASVTAPIVSSTGVASTLTQTFTGGVNTGDTGLRLSDTSGNIISLTQAGNSSASLAAGASVGVISSNGVRFQIGPDSTDSVLFSMPNVGATQLGTTVVAGQSLATVNVTTQAGATQAINIIDAANTQLSQMRGSLGSFQQDFLQSTVRTLNVANENLNSSESYIRDTDIASEMTNYTKEQILQQSGMAILAQANSQPQQVLQLLKGG